MKKYQFRPYSKIYPELFENEKKRIEAGLKNTIGIEHVGSTAVPNLGGKGIIDILVGVDKQEIESACKELQKLGYEFRPDHSTPDRYYFVIYLPDPEEEKRRYHLHLTYPKSTDWEEMLGFRDYLRHHPEAVEEYGEIKKRAAAEANHEGEIYRQMKEPIIKKINSLRNNNHKKNE